MGNNKTHDWPEQGILTGYESSQWQLYGPLCAAVWRLVYLRIGSCEATRVFAQRKVTRMANGISRIQISVEPVDNSMPPGLAAAKPRRRNVTTHARSMCGLTGRSMCRRDPGSQSVYLVPGTGDVVDGDGSFYPMRHKRVRSAYIFRRFGPRRLDILSSR